jgi:TIR domain
MKTGDCIRARIDEVIHLHEKLLLVLSASSLDSDWVEKEVETAFEKERETRSTVLFLVRLDNAVMESKAGWAADIKRARHIGDFRGWKDHDGYQKSLKQLLRDLQIDQKQKDP